MSTRKLRRKYRPSSMPVQGKGRIVRRTLSHRREIDHGKQWYVVRAKAGRERRVTRELREAGFDIFWPTDDRWRIWKHRCSDVSVGWFPGYLFVGFAKSPRFDIIREADGVAGVLGVDGAPLAVRPEVLQQVAEETGNGLARVMVEMFGKKHPVELDFVNLKVA
jgi:transcription antitermination factor NusG